jgi:hypothetical protein
MNRHSLISIAAAMAAAALLACSGSDNDDKPKPPIIPGNVEVCVSGAVFETETAWGYLLPRSLLWKDGAVTYLSEGVQDRPPFGERAYANHVAANGEDVYVAGSKVDGQGRAPVLWKNGEATLLEHNLRAAEARSVAVADGHVYVAGFGQEGDVLSNPQALLWVDGAPPILLSAAGDGAWSQVTSIAVSAAGDVYVAGYTQMGPTLWKNGVAFAPGHRRGAEAPPPFYDYLGAFGEPADWTARLVGTTNPGLMGLHATRACVFASGDDVYFAAWQFVDDEEDSSVVTVWKNGVELMRLGDERFTMDDPVTGAPGYISRSHYLSPTSIFVDGDDVYVTGLVVRTQFDPACPGSTFMTHAVLWKNGEETLLSRRAYDASGYPFDGISSSSAAHCVKVVGGDVYVAGGQLDSRGRCRAALWVNGEMLDLGLGVNSDAFSVHVKEKRDDPSPRQ